MMTDGITYAVTIATQPADQICAVVNGNGTLVGADIINIIISCPLQPAMLSVTSGGPKLLSFSWSDVGADH
ncbi:MAG: hypothetical protein KZQ88_14120 [Candidatus Thiodiazotropha sp. (ex Dulcina madagascariensis)]|nr:hypothetical protein [Candidatus Thiodiazotropha sp. (ex Dulcina madagascariensis)]MCU7924949.1 hypothetical protein [Candidatus Thiodiazotropha sp. (ex Dulcina madagascariensis)]